jgi:hypothetical protein
MCCSTFTLRPSRSGDESESHRTLRTRTDKTSEALVRRQRTYDLLTESLTLDQLCGVRSDNAAVRNCLRGLERHITGIATKRHPSTRVFGSHVVLDDGRSGKQAPRIQDLLQQPPPASVTGRANAGDAPVTTNGKSPLISMATPLWSPIPDTSRCLTFQRLSSLRYRQSLQKPRMRIIESSCVCVLSCNAFRRSDRFTATVSIRQRQLLCQDRWRVLQADWRARLVPRPSP